MSLQTLVVTVIGPDRSGFVGSLSRIIAEHGGNWTSSQMAHLAGQFAGILSVSIEEAKAEKLRYALQQSGGEGFRVSVVTESETAQSKQSGERCRVEIVGQDRRGIVREMSEKLAEHKVNVEELSTSVESAPWSGDMLFKATATVQLPTGSSQDDLRDLLEELADDLMVEVHDS